MSHAAVSGPPTAAQRYVDAVLAAAGTRSSLPAVLLHCLQSWPDDLMIINGATGEKVTNAQMLSYALRLARALGNRSVGQGGRGALMLSANRPALVAAQLGCVLAGVVPLGLDPIATIFELQYFLKLWPPAVVFCEASQREQVLQAIGEALDYSPDVVVLGDGDAWLEQFTQGCSSSLEGFMLPTVSPGDTAVLLPTTGSTGNAKAALVNHAALIAHLGDIWSYEPTFPHPYRRAMVYSSCQWMTWWAVMTSCIVTRVTLVMTSAPLTPKNIWEVLDQCEVSWALMSPSLGARALTEPATRVTSLRMLLVTGSAAHESMLEALQARLPEGGIVRQGYGMTELQGFFSVPGRETPIKSIGKPLNIFKYKLLDEDDKECGINETGELCVKSDCVIKSYLNNEMAMRDSMTSDGWLRTGDRMRADKDGFLYFVERKKFCFKVNNFQVSPEELEEIISGVRGVSDVVVCAGEGGAAALVVRTDESLTRRNIHDAVDARVADYKCLHGGIAFVPSLPLTHNGKIHRRNCLALIEKLQEEKQLYK